MATADNRENLLLLRVGGVHLALPARSIERIVEPPSPLPASTGALPGLFPDGGHAFALVDLRAKLGLAAEPPGRVLLSRAGGQRRAFLVDEVLGSVHEQEARQTSLPADVPRRLFPAALLVGGKVVLRTDPERLLALEPQEGLRRFALLAEGGIPAGGGANTIPAGGEGHPHVPLEEALSRVTAELRRPEPTGARKAVPPRMSGAETRAAPMPPRSSKPPVRANASSGGGGPSFGAPAPEKLPPTLKTPTPVVYPHTAETDPPSESFLPGLKPWAFALLLIGVIAMLALGARYVYQSEGPAQAEVSRAALVPLAPSGTQDALEIAPEPEPPSASEAAPAAEPATEGASDPTSEPTTAPEGSQPSDRLELVVRTGSDTEEQVIIHIVKPGDTLWAIARKYVRDPWAYAELARESGITDPNAIRPGDEVRIILRGEP